MFKFDANNTGFDTIEPGEYEVYMNNYTLGTAKSSGNEMITVNYTIRPDVDQPCKNQEIRYDNFVVTEAAAWRFNSYAKAIGTPDGHDFGDAKGWVKAMLGKPIRVKTSLNDKDYAQVDAIKPSQFPNFTTPPVIKKGGQGQQGQQTSSNPFNNATGPIEISDDDMPF
ncbi:DUF669 domain-containing protein [Macrococcus brunensis]|uniref:DUF669 domain-containing protein n=1 Tax=Macrococcus brunensis TaxID=198483 RepID=UPI001EF1094F|nr:DUF669 domain-containing protein [Macrococcus brunensis]ULG73192.1 DUF669 domain-containing protein [Macrococcus brunensis]